MADGNVFQIVTSVYITDLHTTSVLGTSAASSLSFCSSLSLLLPTEQANSSPGEIQLKPEPPGTYCILNSCFCYNHVYNIYILNVLHYVLLNLTSQEGALCKCFVFLIGWIFFFGEVSCPWTQNSSMNWGEWELNRQPSLVQQYTATVYLQPLKSSTSFEIISLNIFLFHNENTTSAQLTSVENITMTKTTKRERNGEAAAVSWMIGGNLR